MTGWREPRCSTTRGQVTCGRTRRARLSWRPPWAPHRHSQANEHRLEHDPISAFDKDIFRSHALGAELQSHSSNRTSFGTKTQIILLFWRRCGRKTRRSIDDAVSPGGSRCLPVSIMRLAVIEWVVLCTCLARDLSALWFGSLVDRPTAVASCSVEGWV